MMPKIIFTGFLTLFSLLFIVQITFAQKNSIKGLLIDTLHHYAIEGASVSIIPEGSTKIAKISMSDSKGQFHIVGIAENTPLRLEVSHQNYNKLIRNFILKKDQILDFKQLNLNFKENVLNDVKIIAPVRMKGDTIEFNADAFELDTNAVVEDLLNMLPGVMVWGDGKITANGKEIKSVIVDGKPFFGADHRIAVQNIPKEAVDKIQVYDTRSQEMIAIGAERSDEMNIKLKAGKKEGYFGKFGGGKGTKGHYDGDASLNIYNPRSQGTAAFASNNVNKRVYGIDQLLLNSTFGGGNLSSDYSADFSNAGITKQYAGGIAAQHDLINSTIPSKRSLIKLNYFSLYEEADRQNQFVTNYSSALEGLDFNTSTQSLSDQTKGQNHQLGLNYDYSDENTSLNITPSLKIQNQEIKTNNRTSYNYQNSVTESSDTQNSDRSASEFNFNATFGKSRKAYRSNYKWYDKIALSVSSATKRYQRNNSTFRESEAINEDQESLNRSFNRSYLDEVKGLYQEFDFSVPQINAYLFNSELISISLNQKLTLESEQGNQTVFKNEQQLVEDLSYVSSVRRMVYAPALVLSRSLFSKSLFGRYRETLSINANIMTRLFTEKNGSTLAYRNINRSYEHFTPTMSLNYDFNVNSRYRRFIDASWNINYKIPSLDQLVPIYDDINVVNRFYGNAALKPSKQQTLNAGYKYHNYEGLGWFYTINISASKALNTMVDSLEYHPDGIRDHYLTNLKKAVWNRTVSAQAVKPYKINHTQNLSLEFSGRMSSGDAFQYIDGEESLNSYFQSNIWTNILFSMSGHTKVGLLYKLDNSSIKNSRYPENDFSSSAQSYGLNASRVMLKKLELHSDISMRLTKSKYQNDNNTIWNANLIYRAMKGNNLEFKFSVLDLLRQNKGVYVSNTSDSFTIGTKNNLQQYYMVSLAYFPRKFGLKKQQ